MFENLTGRSLYLQTVVRAEPTLCGLLYEDDRGMVVIDARGEKQWVPWPMVRHFEAGGRYLAALAASLPRPGEGER